MFVTKLNRHKEIQRTNDKPREEIIAIPLQIANIVAKEVIWQKLTVFKKEDRNPIEKEATTNYAQLHSEK